MNKIRVLVVDDHPVVQDGLRKALATEEDMEVVAVAGNGKEALDKLHQCEPDVVLLDLTMPGMNGLEVAKLAKEIRPQLGVVAFSMHDGAIYVRRAFAAGATGYIVKGAPVEEVTRAIREVNRGGCYLCPEIQGGVMNALLNGAKVNEKDHGYDSLSDREQQVFRLIAEGNSTKRIGNLLYISPKTVDKHRMNIMRKLCVESLVEMTKCAVRLGIIDADL